MALNRVTNSSLALSFPLDTGRGVTSGLIDKICIFLTKQAYGILYGSGHYSSTVEDSIIDSSECHAVIAAAATRISEEVWQSVHRRRPTPVYVFTIEEIDSLNELLEITYLSAED